MSKIAFEHPRVLLGFLFAFLGTALFSFKSIFIKLAYAQGLDTDSVLMLRMAISFPVYIAVMAVLYFRNHYPKKDIYSNFYLILFLGFIGYFLASWMDLKGLEYISASLERLTLFTYPIFVALFGALLFKIPLSKKIIITLVLTYTGLWFIYNSEVAQGSANTTAGVVFVLMSALCYAFYVLLSKNVIHKIGSLWFTSMAMSASSLFVLIYYHLFFDWSTLNVTTSAWVWLTLLAILSTVIPSFMLTRAISIIGSAQTGIVGTLGPIITIILAMFILNEEMTFYRVIGMLLVISGVLLLTIKKQVKASDE